MNLSYESYYIYFDIFDRLIQKEMSDFNYFGEVSENDLSFSCNVSSIIIKAVGYSDGLEKYITESFNILEKLIFNIEKIENVINKLQKILDDLINRAHNFFKSGVQIQSKVMEEYILKKLKLKNKMKVYENFRNKLNENKIPDEFLFFIRHC